VCRWRSIDATMGDEEDPETFERGADGFCRGDLDAAMVGQETMAGAFGWVVEC
jgi:hypothetical protein